MATTTYNVPVRIHHTAFDEALAARLQTAREHASQWGLLFPAYAWGRMQQRGIDVDDAIEAVAKGEIIEYSALDEKEAVEIALRSVAATFRPVGHPVTPNPGSYWDRVTNGEES